MYLLFQVWENTHTTCLRILNGYCRALSSIPVTKGCYSVECRSKSLVLSRAMVLIPVSSVILATLGVVVFVRRRKQSNRLRHFTLPPGPPGLPIIGNLFDLAKEHAWAVYSDWSKIYGKGCFLIHLYLATNTSAAHRRYGVFARTFYSSDHSVICRCCFRSYG